MKPRQRYAIVASRFNQTITARLVAGAMTALTEAGVAADAIAQFWVPGAFEIPGIARRLAASQQYCAIITLGAVIRGETTHYDLVAGECARAIAQLNLYTDTPIVFGILTTNTIAQAEARAGPHNKGAEVACAAMQMAELVADLPAADTKDLPGGSS